MQYGWIFCLLGGKSWFEPGVGIELPGETCGVGERDDRFGPVDALEIEQEGEVNALTRIDEEVLRFLRMRCEFSEPVRRERACHSACLSVFDHPVGESDRALALVDREVGAVLHAHHPT